MSDPTPERLAELLAENASLMERWWIDGVEIAEVKAQRDALTKELWHVWELAESVGVGWIEFIKMPEATTHIAYIYSSGEVYLPDGENVTALYEAHAAGRAWHLIRAADVLTSSLADAKPKALG